MDISTMRADCARCAALCCVALAFDRSPLFAVSKANGEVCRHLGENDCRIYARRIENGFAGCVAYDCLGAGQRVTQEIFGGGTWRHGRAKREAMLRAFAKMRRIHELLLLLDTASRAPLPPSARHALGEYWSALTPNSGWSEDTIAAFDLDGLDRDVRAFLATLASHLDQRDVEMSLAARGAK